MDISEDEQTIKKEVDDLENLEFTREVFQNYLSVHGIDITSTMPTTEDFVVEIQTKADEKVMKKR